MSEPNSQDDGGSPPDEPQNADENPRWLQRIQAGVLVINGAAGLMQLVSAGVMLHWW
jgi:hypothetical protein